MTDFKPAESIMLATPIGLDTLGAEFKVEAPFTACRLCGAVFQTAKDRACKEWLEQGLIIEHFNTLTRESYFTGNPHCLKVLDESTQARQVWRENHESLNHTDEEINLLHSTGFAFTPEAAHKLAPFGIIPLGIMHEEITDALFTAPRAPSVDAES